MVSSISDVTRSPSFVFEGSQKGRTKPPNMLGKRIRPISWVDCSTSPERGIRSRLSGAWFVVANSSSQSKLEGWSSGLVRTICIGTPDGGFREVQLGRKTR